MTRALARVAFTVIVAAQSSLLPPPALAAAGEYSITPLRIDLDRNARSAVVTLTNTGSDSIDFQISAMEWTQDAEARDSYAPSTDVVFFPKILTLKPEESRVVRIGVQSTPPARERTYRLFVEPIPKRSQEPLPPGAHVSVNLRFALPIFVKPPIVNAAGEIDHAALRDGKLTLAVRNTGNEHLRFDDGAALIGRDADGREILSQRLELRYVLAGAAKPLSYTLPKEVCARLASLEVHARAPQLTLSQTLAASRASCE